MIPKLILLVVCSLLLTACGSEPETEGPKVSDYLPNKCDLGSSAPVNCEEMQLDSASGELLLGIRNIAQQSIVALRISAEDDRSLDATNHDVLIGGSPVSIDNPLGPGEIGVVAITLMDGVKVGEELRGTLTAEYQFRDRAGTQTSSGDLRVLT